MDDVASNNASGAVTAGPLTLATLQEAAKAQKEWAKYVAFDGEGRILFGNVKPLDGEITGFLKLFDKRECALASGRRAM
ncbi:hypothetical protein Plhal304r1_c082g0166941 [Plasmopara halstedii]